MDFKSMSETKNPYGPKAGKAHYNEQLALYRGNPAGFLAEYHTREIWKALR
jgi:hypothetical protein